MRISFSLGPLLALVLASNAGAQSYTIKLKHYPDGGKSAVNKDTSRQTGKIKIVDANGKAIKDDTTTETEDIVYTETTLETDGQAQTKYKRSYEKAVYRTGDKEAKHSYEGGTVVFELKDGKYQIAVDGEPALDKKDLD